MTLNLFPSRAKPVPTASEQERIDWLRLARTNSVGPVTFYRLVETYGSAGHALDALPDLSRRGGRQKPLTPPPAHAVEQEMAWLHKHGGTIILATDSTYPLALGAIEDAPPVLSILGDVALLQKPSVAIVGARNASLNGKRFAQDMARELGDAGYIVTSGLARGIDTAAHEGALANGTVAVVAGGIDVVYPQENQKLYDRIREQGAIVAESPLGQQPFAQSFPRRNRIVSGLSAGVVVVEATERSGSLITARLAGEQGRDVYAVPGHPLDPRASGPNRLIRDGAVLVRNAGDILEGLQSFSGGLLRDGHRQTSYIAPPPPAPIQVDGNDDARARDVLAGALSYTPTDIDGLIRLTGLAANQVQIALLEMELAGRIKRLPGHRCVLL